MNPLPIIGPIINAVSGAYKSRQERKTAVAKVKSAVEIRKTDSDYNLALSDKEWELIGKSAESNSLKDEFVTAVVFSPIIALILGTFLAPDLSLLQAAQLSIREINSLDMTSGYGLLLWITALSALGLKAWKR